MLGACSYTAPTSNTDAGDTGTADDPNGGGVNLPPDGPTAGSDGAPFACPTGYQLRVAGSCLRVVASAVTWDVAEADCESAGAHLVVVDDADEDLSVPDNVWIGFTELVTPGTFQWVTGIDNGFRGFASGEPGSVGGASCVEARADGWHDDNCPESKNYACEYDGHAADPARF